MRAVDLVEFWLGNAPYAGVESSFMPDISDLVSINGCTYMVTSRNFCVDWSGDNTQKRMRLVCNVVRYKPAKKRTPK